MRRKRLCPSASTLSIRPCAWKPPTAVGGSRQVFSSAAMPPDVRKVFDLPHIGRHSRKEESLKRRVYLPMLSASITTFVVISLPSTESLTRYVPGSSAGPIRAPKRPPPRPPPPPPSCGCP